MNKNNENSIKMDNLTVKRGTNENIDLVINWLREKIKPGKTLVYFASGNRIDSEYQNLNFENIILVDYGFRDCSYDGKKIFCLALDSIVAVFVLKKLDIKIDCFVCINEGLYEGGGKYAINSDMFLGYCFPLFTDKLVHIGYKEYYCGDEYFHLREHFLDLPFKDRSTLSIEDSEYINPSIFSPCNGDKALVTLLEKKSILKHSFKVGKMKVHVKHASIWEYRDNLDALFISYENNDQKTIVENLESKVIDMKSVLKPSRSSFSHADIDYIHELCARNNYEKIGFTPFGHDYMGLVHSLEKKGITSIKEVSIFHLNKDDLKYLYREKLMKRNDFDPSEAICIYLTDFY